MRKVFVTLCPQDGISFLPEGIYTELYYAPLYEHAYAKIENAVKALGFDYKVVRASGCGIPNTVSEIKAALEDIVIFASPFVFLAKNADVEGAINYITKTDLGYSTVGTERSIYMTVGISKMISKSSVGTPYEFINAITDAGAMCPHAGFADNEPSLPKGRLDFYQKAERYRRELLEYHLRAGVCLDSLDAIVISPTVSIEAGAKIHTGCHIFGKSTIFKGAEVGPNAIIKNSSVGENTRVGASRIEDSVLEKDTLVEDSCVIKEKCHLISDSRVCSFCEISNSLLRNGAHISSHCHIWDAEVGARTIVGSGVITVNYEATRKTAKCVIGDDAVIGCGSCLVLPVEVGVGSFVAAGSTITDDVPTGALAIAREYQTNRNGWASRRKKHGKHF